MKRRLLPFAPHALLVAAVLPLALGAGCRSEVDPDAAAAPAPPVASLDIGGQSDPSVGISVRVRNGERERRVNLRPLAEKRAKEGYVPPYFPAGMHAPKAGPQAAAARATAALTGAHVLDTGEEAVIDGSAWLAVVAAGAECGLGDPDAEDVFSARQRAIVPAWRADPAGGNAFTLFESPPATCSEAAWQEQMLLCVADKLVALTDAVGPTEWAAPGRLAPEDGIPQGTWTIDAPKEDGKVILRELALTLLASLAVTDMTVPTESRGSATCSQLLGQASQDPAFAEANAHALFGASAGEMPPYLPPRIEVSGANARALATARLATTAHTLRAAGRLLRTTVADALEADASYARIKAAKLGEPAAWGQTDTTSYNDWSHSARLLYGRLDLGSGTPDPHCAGVLASRTLSAGFPARETRTAIRLPSTERERVAYERVAAAQFALPEAYAATATPMDLRVLLLDQLLGREAARQGVSKDDPTFQESLEASAIRTSVGDLSDSEIRYAVLTTSQQYALSTDGGLLALGDGPLYLDPGVREAGGTTFVPPPPGEPAGCRQTGALSARMASIASCPEYGGRDGALSPDLSFGTAYENVAGLATTLYRRSVVAREAASSAEGATQSLLRGTAAELRSLSGGRRVVFSREEGRLQVHLLGFAGSQLGGTDPDVLARTLGLVKGPASRAECAAQLRGDCGSNPDEAIVRPSRVQVRSTTPELAAQTGFDGLWVTAEFDADVATAEGTSGPMYLLSSGLSKNNIIASAAEGIADGTAIGTTPVGGLLQVPPDEVIPLCPGTATSCAGTLKPPYVALESDLLGGDGDPFESSWRSYVGAAKEAAQRADDLGRKLIDLGQQQDLRRESTGDELAAICGDVNVNSKVAFDGSGNVFLPTPDPTLETCLAEPKYDITLLTKLPEILSAATLSTQSGQSAALSYVRQLVNCEKVEGGQAVINPNAVSSPVCTKLVPGVRIRLDLDKGWDPKDFYVGSLDLADFQGDVNLSPTGQECRKLQDATQGIVAGGYGTSAVQQYLNDFPVTLEALKPLVHAISIPRDPVTGNWGLYYADRLVMSSWPGDGLFPGCITSQAAPCNTQAAAFARQFLADSVSAAPCGPTDVPVTDIDGSQQCIRLLSAFGGTPAADMLGLVYWRVLGATWLMSSMAGSAPPWKIAATLPAVDFNAPGAAGVLAPAPTIYGKARFVPYGVDGFRIDDTAYPGSPGLVVYKPTGAVRLPAGSPEVPAWLGVAENGSPDVYKRFPIGVWGFEWTQGSSTALQDWLKGTVEQLGSVQCATSDKFASFGGWPAGTTPLGQSPAEIAFRSVAWRKRPMKQSYDPTQMYWGHLLTPGVTAGDGGLSVDYLQSAVVQSPWGNTVFNDDRVGPAGKLGACYANQPNGGFANLDASCAVPWKGAADPTPEARAAYLGINIYPPHGPCGAAAELTSALGLSCLLAKTPTLPLYEPPPQVTTPADLGKLGTWYGAQSLRIRQMLSRLYVTATPRRVVADFKEGRVGTGTTQGEKGQSLLQLEQALQEVFQAWLQVSKNASLLQDIMNTATLQMHAAELQKSTETTSVDIQISHIHQAQAQAFAGIVSSVGQFAGSGFGGVFSVTGAAINAAIVEGYGLQQKNYLDKLNELSNEKFANAAAMAMAELNKSSAVAYTDLASSFSSIRGAIAAGMISSQRMEDLEEKAKLAAAKGTGQDFLVIDGAAVPLPVNAVLNRDYDTTQARYKRAFRDARYLACLGRLSLEQRLGVRFEKMQAPLGELPPPASWANDLLVATPIDYKALSCTHGTPSAPGKPCVPASSDTQRKAYLGDYIANLEHVVPGFAAAYPLHEGQDTTVLSLAHDLVGQGKACVRPSVNLLQFSGLMKASMSDPATGLVGWQNTGCSPTSCLLVAGAPADAVAPVPVDGPSVSLLQEVEAADGTPAAPGVPANFVYQEVELVPGTYVASWWANARTPEGALGTVPVSYQVAVFDAEWTLYASKSANAPVGVGTKPGEVWPDRHSFVFSIKSPGKYRFGVRGTGSEALNIGMAGLQLERSTSAEPSASPYEQTGESREVIAGSSCVGSPGDVRSSFDRVCEGGECWFVSRRPIVIRFPLPPYADLNPPKGYDKEAPSLDARFSKGNYNYRHEALTVNLVGTNVHDCGAGPSPACYASGFEEYELVHDASDVFIRNPVNGLHPFDFATAAIRGGKALAAEKYLTVPLGSADASLVTQSGLEKTELRGRPIAGTYYLKIKDSPSLRWSHVEDVQILLRYRYWSHTPAKAP